MPKRPFTFMAVPAIREAARADAGVLAQLMGEMGCPVTPEAFWARIERMAGPSHRTFVADLDGRVVGFAGCSTLAIYESDHPTCWVMAFVVSQPFRRHGVGRILIQAVERWSAEQGLPDIRMHCAEGSADTHAFYEACGFVRSGLRFKKPVDR